jgi:hypothetical protein
MPKEPAQRVPGATAGALATGPADQLLDMIAIPENVPHSGMTELCLGQAAMDKYVGWGRFPVDVPWPTPPGKGGCRLPDGRIIAPARLHGGRGGPPT